MPGQKKPFDLIVWIKHHYLTLIIIFLFIYLLFAFLAPVLVQAGFEQPAKWLYRGYSNLCHQYAYRSWFLFGHQAHYPLSAEGTNQSIYDVMELPQENPQISREMIGSGDAGYKVAICQRDVALYGGLLIFALIFIAFGRKIKPIPFYLWILLAVIPIGADGLLQLAGSYDLFTISYESTPLMRSLTGAMFGIFSGWLLFPAIELSMKDNQT